MSSQRVNSLGRAQKKEVKNKKMLQQICKRSSRRILRAIKKASDECLILFLIWLNDVFKNL
jgi:hypothetical protein